MFKMKNDFYLLMKSFILTKKNLNFFVNIDITDEL